MEDQQPDRTDYFDPRRLVLRWLISTLSIFAAVWAVPGVEFQGPGWQLGIVAIVFGLLSALMRPLLMFVSIVTLGLLGLGIFGLVINALMLVMTSAMAEALDISFRVEHFWAAFLGGMVISTVSLVLGMLAGDNRIIIRVHRGEEDID